MNSYNLLYLNRDSVNSVASIDEAALDVPCNHIVGLVIYNLPRRQCIAAEIDTNITTLEATAYRARFIDGELCHSQ